MLTCLDLLLVRMHAELLELLQLPLPGLFLLSPFALLISGSYLQISLLAFLLDPLPVLSLLPPLLVLDLSTLLSLHDPFLDLLDPLYVLNKG